jgi:cellulose 1,4-beta-cellobiosidase
MKIILLIVSYLFAQQIGPYSQEVHPSITWKKCSSTGCVEQKGGIVLDMAWRWKHIVGDYTDCDTSGTPLEIAKNCALEGVDYEQYGVGTNGDELTMFFVVPNGGVGSRLYFLVVFFLLF